MLDPCVLERYWSSREAAKYPFFVVISGELEAVRPSFGQETLIRTFGPGQFTGELNTLSGRRAIARIRARQDGEIVEIARDKVLALVQADEQLSEILMRAFILRRAELLAQGIGDVTLVRVQLFG
jgi:thioredoxin reductase (NADPH)